MEKRTRTYDLDALKMAFATTQQLRITASGLQGARAMGFNSQDIIDAIHLIQRSDFVKSMTTYHNHHIWQDVYLSQMSFRNYNTEIARNLKVLIEKNCRNSHSISRFFD